MNIFIASQAKYSVLDIGFDRSLIRVGQNVGSAQDEVPPDMQNVFSNGLSSALLGSQALGSDISFGHQFISAVPSDNLQELIETLSARGGGTLRLGPYTYKLTSNLQIKSNINIIGEGRDNSILDFGSGGFGITAYGTATTLLKNIKFHNFTVQNTGTTGIDMDYVDYWSMDNVRTTVCVRGIRIQHSEFFTLINVRSDTNTNDGFEINGGPAPLKETKNFSLYSCVSSSNGGKGFDLSVVNSSPTALFYCSAKSNTDDGFAIPNSTGRNVRLFGCNSESNGGDGFDVDADDISLYGCYTAGNTGDGINFSQYRCLAIGCDFTDGTVYPDKAQFLQGNNGDLNDKRDFFNAKNTSGGVLAAGSVVVMKAVASGREVTATTTAGDDKVIGMVIGANSSSSIVDNGEGQIMIEGFTSLLKVDGTTDIAIGDFLGTFTTAGIAMKAAAGDMCFAMALEAYTTNDSNGVIDAVLFTPRLI